MEIGKDYVGIGLVFACHDGAGKFLFAKRGKGARNGHGEWEIPAGGLEYGETLENGLARELKEELTASPKHIEFIGHKEMFLRNETGEVYHHWIAFEFLVELNPEEVVIGEPDKCEAIEWLTLENAPANLHNGTAETIANIIAYQKRMR